MWDPYFEGARSARECSPSIGSNFDLLVRLEQSDEFCAGMVLVVTLLSELCAMIN